MATAFSRNCRFYGTRDRALRIRLAGNGKPMGSRFKTDSLELEIEVNHDEIIDMVKLVSNGGAIIREWSPGGPEFETSLTLPVDSDDATWYVALAEIPGERFAISAPIIVKKK